MTDQQKPAEAGNGAEAKFTPEQTDAYIKQLREEAKQNRLAAEAASAQLLVFQKAQEKAEADRLAEQGKFKDLYEKTQTDLQKRTTEAEQASAYRDAFKASLDARVAQIPEGMRSLVPDSMEPIALSQWLDKNAALLSNRKPPPMDPGAGGSGAAGGGKVLPATPADIAMAANFRMPVAEWMKQKAAMEQDHANPPPEQ